MYHAAVLTVSDRSFRGERPDAGGPLVVEMLKNAGYEVTVTVIVPDEQAQIEEKLRQKIGDERIVTVKGVGYKYEP